MLSWPPLSWSQSTGLVDLKYPRTLWKQDRLEASILLVTVLVTLTLSLPLGIGVGIILSIALVVHRMMHPHVAVLGNVQGVFRNVERFTDAKTSDDVLVVRYDGALNFANQAHFRTTLGQLVQTKGDKLKLIILQADTLSYIDASARATIRAMILDWKSQGVQLCMAGAIGPVRDALASDGLLESGEVCFRLNVHQAMEEYNAPGTMPQSLKDLAQQHQ